MLFKSLTYASILAVASAQSLTEVIANQTDLSTLNGLLTSQPDLTGQLASLNNVTILAPSNEALSALLNSTAGAAVASDPGLLTAILQYHILQGAFQAAQIPDDLDFVPSILNNTQYANVSGGQVVGVERDDNNVTLFSGLLQNSSVSQANVNFTGGVIHVIDNVLTLPPSASDTLSAAGLSSLAGALTSANLVDTINGLENVTIFAPNNAAFQNISSALEGLSPENVTRILQYHVIQGEEPLYSTRLTDGANVTTLAGSNVTISISDSEGVFVNGARVVLPNVLIAGGVVHVIDNVLNPDNTTAAADGAEQGSGAFGNATAGAEPPFTSGQPQPTTTIGGSTPTGSPGSQATSSSTAGAVPMATGAIGAAALFGAGIAFLNI